MDTGNVIFIGFGMLFWAIALFFISKIDTITFGEPELCEDSGDIEEEFDPKQNQLIAQKYYRGVTRADLETRARSLGIQYSDDDSYIDLKTKVDKGLGA